LFNKENPTAAYRQIEMLYDKFSLLAAGPFLGEVRDDLGTNLRSFFPSSRCHP
jgi:plasmid stabilization system protein ParE